MLAKIFLVLAAVCVVKASAIPDDIFDETDPEAAVASESRCFVSDCTRQCRRLGFSSGICISGQCFCRHSTAQQDAPAAAVASESRCFVSDCTRQCRRLGFSSGICISGQCFCRHSTAQDVAEQTLSNLENLAPQKEDAPEAGVASESRCFVSDCTRQCRRLGFASGICISGQCFCRHSTAQEDDAELSPSNLEDLVPQIENNPEVASDPRQCIPRECKRQCHRQGYGNGLCIAGQCRCRRVFAAQVNDPETEVANNPRQCIPSNCKAACRRQGFGNGYCVAGQCRCTALKAEVDDAELFNLDDLVSQIGGSFRGFVQKAIPDENTHVFIRKSELIFENDPETEVARNPLKCDDAKCNRKCRDKGFARGGCYLGRCKCRRN